MNKSITSMALAAMAIITSCQPQGNEQPEAGQLPIVQTAVIPATNDSVIVLLGHPDINKSQANAALAAAAEEVEGVQVINVLDYPMLPETYSECIGRAKAIVYQFPFYWASAPYMIKQWTDEVFHVFANNGDMEGKLFMVTTTTGAPAANYTPEGANHYTMEQLLSPYHMQAIHSRMAWQSPLVVYAVGGEAGPGNIQKGCEAYRQRLEELKQAGCTAGE